MSKYLYGAFIFLFINLHACDDMDLKIGKLEKSFSDDFIEFVLKLKNGYFLGMIEQDLTQGNKWVLDYFKKDDLLLDKIVYMRYKLIKIFQDGQDDSKNKRFEGTFRFIKQILIENNILSE